MTANGRGLLLGNPHFPWTGVNRFWEMHLTIPGRLDVMGAAIGHSSLVQIGFNKDVAWTHTVSTGKRFTLYELQLAEDDPTRYVLDGELVAMSPREIVYEARTADGREWWRLRPRLQLVQQSFEFRGRVGPACERRGGRGAARPRFTRFRTPASPLRRGGSR